MKFKYLQKKTDEIKMKLKIKSNLFYLPVLGQKENVRIDNIAGGFN